MKRINLPPITSSISKLTFCSTPTIPRFGNGILVSERGNLSNGVEPLGPGSRLGPEAFPEMLMCMKAVGQLMASV